VLRKIFGPKRKEVTGQWRKLHMRSCMICIRHQILVTGSHEGEQDGWGMWLVWGRIEMRTGFR
jgi:hypothetical protein